VCHSPPASCTSEKPRTPSQIHLARPCATVIEPNPEAHGRSVRRQRARLRGRRWQAHQPFLPPSANFHPAPEARRAPPITFHDLRHTCASLLFQKNVHPKFVQELLGHASVAITLDIYSHMLPGMGGEAADAMGKRSGSVHSRLRYVESIFLPLGSHLLPQPRYREMGLSSRSSINLSMSRRSSGALSHSHRVNAVPCSTLS